MDMSRHRSHIDQVSLSTSMLLCHSQRFQTMTIKKTGWHQQQRSRQSSFLIQLELWTSSVILLLDVSSGMIRMPKISWWDDVDSFGISLYY